MPAHATHMIILDLVIDKMKVRNREISDVLERNSDVAYFGSIGPDVYFFAPDMNDPMRNIMYAFFKLYDDIIGPILNFYETKIKPVTDALEPITEPVGGVLDDVACGALTDLAKYGKDTVGNIKSAMGAALADLVTDSINFFNLFTPPIQQGKREEEWFWFDMLHYRYTSEYIINLVNALPRRESESGVGLAYAMGHLTHIAGDVMGHAYVNQIVGGPYRAHNRRHHIQENFMDVWAHYYYKGGEELIGAKLHHKFTAGASLDERLLRKVAQGLTDPPPEKLKDLFRRLEQAFRETYGEKPHPKRISSEFLTSSDINVAYWLNLASLKFATDCMLPPVEPPTEDLLEEINRRMEDLERDLGRRPDPPSSPGHCWSFWRDDCNFSWEAVKSFVEFVWESIEYIAKSIVWALEVLWDLIRFIECIIIESLVLPIKGILWIIRSLFQEMYQNFRDALVIAGYALPNSDYLFNSPLGRKLTISTGTWDAFKKYPRMQSSPPNEPYLKYPETDVESLSTMGGPYLSGATPKDFIEGISMDWEATDEFARAQDHEAITNIQQSRGPMGNAVEYAAELISQTYDFWKRGLQINADSIPNWNLDADRGYGYKCWDDRTPPRRDRRDIVIL